MSLIDFGDRKHGLIVCAGLATGLPHCTEQVRFRVLCVCHRLVRIRANNISCVLSPIFAILDAYGVD